jgi:hypothetical protein
VPLRLSGSRLLFCFQENTGDFDFRNDILLRWDVRFADFLSNGNLSFLRLSDQSDFGISRFYYFYRPLSGHMFRFTKKTQKCKKLTKNDKGIGQEMLWRKFESNENDGQIIYFGFSFCRIVEKFNFFETSKFGYIDVIFSIECIFPDFSTFWSNFVLSLIFILYCNVYLNLNLNFFWKKESMIRNIQSICFVNTKDRTDCYPFFSKFSEEKELESFLESKRYFFHQFLELKWKEF